MNFRSASHRSVKPAVGETWSVGRVECQNRVPPVTCNPIVLLPSSSDNDLSSLGSDATEKNSWSSKTQIATALEVPRDSILGPQNWRFTNE